MRDPEEITEIPVSAVLAERTARISSAVVVLGVTTLKLVQLNPTDPTVRSMVMAACHKPVPEEATTPEAIIDWVEFNIPEPLEKQPEPRRSPAVPRPDPVAVTIGISASETESGHCLYSLRRSGDGEFKFTSGELLSEVEDADNMDDLMDRLYETIRDNYGDVIDMETDEGSEEYSNYESNDTDSSGVEYSTERLREQVLNWLSTHHPEQYDRLSS